MQHGTLKIVARQIAGRLATSTPPNGPGDPPPPSTIDFITPGTIIREELMNPHGFSEMGLARLASIHPATLKRVLNGQQTVTPTIARCFHAAFDVSAEFFMNLQDQYDYRIENFRAAMAREMGPPRAPLRSPFIR